MSLPTLEKARDTEALMTPYPPSWPGEVPRLSGSELSLTTGAAATRGKFRCHPPNCFSVSYVRKGSFGYRSRGRSFELVPARSCRPSRRRVLCTHDHVRGDECLSFHFSPALVDTLGESAPALALRPGPAAPGADGARRARRRPRPPGAATSPRRDRAAARGTLRRPRLRRGHRRRRPPQRDRRRAVETALWIEAHSHERSTSARAARPGSARSTSCALRARARRDAAPVSRALAPAPRGAPPRRRRAPDHRRRLRRRLRRPLELRAQLPPRRRRLAAGLPPGGARRPHDLPLPPSVMAGEVPRLSGWSLSSTGGPFDRY